MHSPANDGILAAPNWTIPSNVASRTYHIEK